MKKELPAGEGEQRLSPRLTLYIQMAIDQYHTLYVPAANAKGLPLITEADYVVLALKNYDEFEANIEHCKLFGHKMQTACLSGTEIEACARCGATGQLAEIILIAQGLSNNDTSRAQAEG